MRSAEIAIAGADAFGKVVVELRPASCFAPELLQLANSRALHTTPTVQRETPDIVSP